MMKQVGTTDLCNSLNTEVSSRQRRSPTYVYRKQGILYFRYVFTSSQKKQFQHTELRISLRTSFLSIAKKIARKLYVTLEGLLMSKDHTLF